MDLNIYLQPDTDFWNVETMQGLFKWNLDLWFVSKIVNQSRKTVSLFEGK